MQWLFATYALGIGAIVGSFLNVVIHRYPREESIVFPASHCPNCNTAIKPYDNIPLVSYAILGGRCRSCHQPISIRYPLVELANALFYLAIFQRTGLSLLFLPIAALASMTLVLIYIDAEIQMLPDVITYPGIAIGMVIGALHGGDMTSLTLSTSLVDAAGGALLGAALITTIILVYWLVRRVEGMGWGDAKMLAMIGAALGWEAVLAVVLIGSISGAVIGVPIALRSANRMMTALPFGVFLGLATLIVLFFGHTLGQWSMAPLLAR